MRGSSQAGHVTALVLVGQPCHASLVRRDTRHFMTPLRAKFFIMTMMHLWDDSGCLYLREKWVFEELDSAY